MLRTFLLGAGLSLALLIPVAAAAQADRVVVESLRTAGHAARDGARTAGRTVRSFFKGGSQSAAETARENARTTGQNARRNAARVRQAGGR